MFKMNMLHTSIPTICKHLLFAITTKKKLSVVIWGQVDRETKNNDISNTSVKTAIDVTDLYRF